MSAGEAARGSVRRRTTSHWRCDTARIELNELNWHDMLVFGVVAVGVLLVLARLLLKFL
jgi:hypothetical protein